VGKQLPASVVRSSETVKLAQSLVGRLLVTRLDGRRVAKRIVEVEAYDGPRDRACHASRGRTPRTEVMFRPGSLWYVYLCYGVHEMLNLVTGPRDYPAAILIRGVEGVSGPGRVTRALDIDRRFNGHAATRSTGLWIEDDGFAVRAANIKATPRIGIAYAGEPWVSKPWRFIWRRD